MQILTHVQQNSYIIELTGTLDSNNAYSVKNALTDALQYNPKEIILDCERLEAISPRSLKSLRNTIRGLQKNQVGVVLLSVNNHLNNLFTCLGINAFTQRVNSTSLIGCSDDHCDIYFRKL